MYNRIENLRYNDYLYKYSHKKPVIRSEQNLTELLNSQNYHSEEEIFFILRLNIKFY